MSKRGQETQGGEERYGFSNGPGDMSDRPQQANAAQMARRKIAAVKKSGASARSSRANTPNANPFAPQQQSMPSFQLPQQGGGDGGSFNFSVNAPSNPFQNANDASGTPPPSFAMGQQPQQQNGGGGVFGNSNTSFGFGSNASTQPQTNGFSFGSSNTNANNSQSFGGFGQNKNNQTQGQQNGATRNSNTASFSFGGQPNGNTTESLQFGQSQPQAQSTQGTSFNFGQNTQTNGDKPAANPFAGFGQSKQQQGSEKPATPFSFGQTAQQPAEKPATPSLGMFGQSNTAQAQPNGDKAPMFGAAPQTDQTPKPNTGSLFTFNSSNRGIGNRPTPEPAAKPSEAPNPPLSNLFGAQQSTGAGLFGSTPPPRESSATPKPGDSIFSTQAKPKLGGNLFTSDMAEGERPESPAPMFGQLAQQKEQAAPDADQTPKPSNMFGGLGQSPSNVVQDTPKPSSNLFSASSFGKTPAQPTTAPKNFFAQSTQDTSMNTPGSTPQKSSLFTPAASQQATAPAERPTVTETPAPNGSLFDRITRSEETPAAAQEVEKSSSEQAPAATQESLFAPSTRAFNTLAPQSTLSSDLLSKSSENTVAPDAPRASNLSAKPSTSQAGRTASIHYASTLADILPDQERDTFKVLNEGLIAHIAIQNPTLDWTTIMEYYLRQAAIIRHKPAPDLAALSAPPFAPPTTAQNERSMAPSQPNGGAKPTPPLQSQPVAPSTSRPNNMFGSSSAATPKAPTLFQKISSSDSQQTPKPSSFQPPSTAPVNRKRSAEDEYERPPATEKRAKASESIEYPKLPGNASDVSKLFYNALENKASGSPPPSQKISNPAQDSEKVPTSTAPPPTAQLKPSAGGFTPSTSSFTPSASGFKPSASGFTPSMPSSVSNNFLAAFGKKASEQQEKDREKRKDDDYDSEDETEEQWAERDRKKQEAKRAKVLEDSKASSGFLFKPASKSSEAQSPKALSTQRGDGDDKSNTENDQPTESGQGKSLFDQISKPTPSAGEKPSLFSAQTPNPKATTSNINGSSGTPASTSLGSSLFGHLSKPGDSLRLSDGTEKGEAVEKQTQGTGDNTWTQSTPIKFGGAASIEATSTTPAAAPPAFGSLFGLKSQASDPSNTGLLNVPAPKPAMGFGFGLGTQSASASGSRATTPGVTTDGEGTGASTAGDGDNEPSDDPPANEAQVEDMTGLSAEETKNETLLFNVVMSKASKWEEKKNDEGGMAQGWVDKGKGPLYLLKNDDTGKVRVLLKVPPYGAAKMNFPLIAGGGYEVQGKAGKQITGVFYDHMAEGKKLGKWLIQVGKKEDADEVGRIFKENTPKE